MKRIPTTEREDENREILRHNKDVAYFELLEAQERFEKSANLQGSDLDHFAELAGGQIGFVDSLEETNSLKKLSLQIEIIDGLTSTWEMQIDAIRAQAGKA